MEAWPLRMITSTSGLICLISFRVASPSIPGMRISRTMTSQGLCLSSSRASAPLLAPLTVSPSASSIFWRLVRNRSSSSTSNIRGLGMGEQLQFPAPGQGDGELGALAYRAFHRNSPSQPQNDSMADGEPQPRALPRRLGSEKRVEDLRQILL